jgi:uncharacterized protein YutE (UPF0331/DUF86 family)
LALRRDAIEERLAKLDGVLTLLQSLQGLDGAALRADPIKLSAAERGLQVAIECLLDIGNHILSALCQERPRTYTDVIDALGAHGVLPREFAERVRPLAGLRNRLVHLYLTVDPNQIAEHLTRLDDFREFARYVVAYLDR